ncbi:MAG: hypothetical protein WD875_05540 [Pirellulales bacterium]
MADERERRTDMRRKWIIAGVLCFIAAIALGVRYGPHLVLKIALSFASNDVDAIPTKPLVVPPAGEPTLICTIGPVSFAVPTSMTKDIAFERGSHVYVTFQDANRSVILLMPQSDDHSLQDSIVGFPDKARLTFSRLYVEICEAKSSDFSFAMSRRELSWHGWLMAQRVLMPDLEIIEYLWRDDIDGHLIVVAGAPVYQWSTTDSQWQGYLYFRDTKASSAATDWMRRTSASLAINGDPAVFAGLDEHAVEAMMVISNGKK